MSLQSNIQHSLSETRTAFTQTPTSVSEHAPFPQVKTNVGITFSELSSIVIRETKAATANGGGYTASGLETLMDALHRAPRLAQWHSVENMHLAGYQLWTKDDLMHVLATTDAIKVVKGIRIFGIATGLPAEAIYNAINSAQAVVAKLEIASDHGDDEFFTADATGADLDAAL